MRPWLKCASAQSVRQLSGLFLSLFCVFCVLPAIASDGETVRIIAFGDSTTAPRSSVAQVYSARLQTKLESRDIDCTVINEGVPGSHTGRLADNSYHVRRHALDRFDDAVRARHPNIVIIQFGWNDSWIDDGRRDGKSRIPVEDFRSNLRYMVDSLQHDGVQVVLMTPNQPHSTVPKWQVSRTQKYVAAVRRLSQRSQVPLVDVWDAYSSFGSVDGQSADKLLLDRVHPNDKGHELVAAMLADRIERLLKKPPRGYSIPTIDISQQKNRQTVVDREQGQYLGHPTTVLLEDKNTVLCVYPKGHAVGEIVYKRSTDGGRTWSDRLPTPESWKTGREVPTIYRVQDKEGKKRLILFSGLYPIRMAVSEDDGASWSELEPIGNFGGIVAMASVIPLMTGAGHYMALFHDDGRFLRGGPGDHYGSPAGKFTGFKVYKTLSTDGGLTWSEPQPIASHPDAHLCEPGAIRSPDGKQLAVLLRENSRRHNSFVIFTNDEGKTWSEPRELPGALTGDRHAGVYGPDGRLFISFRDTTHISPTKGDWVAWVGNYDDIIEGNEGQYRVRMMDNLKGADCGYPDVEVLADGTILATTYGHWDQGEAPYIVTVRLRLEELDALLDTQSRSQEATSSSPK